MAWRYCPCGQGTDVPDAQENIQGFQVCVSCGSKVHLDEEERQRFFLDMHQRLEQVERQVETLIKATKLIAKIQKDRPA